MLSNWIWKKAFGKSTVKQKLNIKKSIPHCSEGENTDKLNKIKAKRRATRVTKREFDFKSERNRAANISTLNQ